MKNYIPLLKDIEQYVEDKMKMVDAGHDMNHIYRVLANAKKINKVEQGNVFLVEAGVLLHDITDEKLFEKEKAEKELNSFLLGLGIKQELSETLFGIINAVSFGAEFDKKKQLTIEQKIVRDADRLDAIGAIGIARTFHYGGRKNREIFNKAIAPQVYQSTKEYRNSDAPTINHFYEKLLLLKDKMETNYGKQMAEQRHVFMLEFLEQFYKDVGESGFTLK